MKISTVIQQENIQFDRYLGATLTLPWSGFDNIRIQPNDLAIQHVVNLSLEKLYQNFLYLYKSSRVASNIVPIGAIAIAGVSASDNRFIWHTYQEGLCSSIYAPLSTVNLSAADTTQVIYTTQNRNNLTFSIFTSNGTNLLVFNSDRRFFEKGYNYALNASPTVFDYSLTITPVFSSSEIYKGSGVYWQKINDIIQGPNDTMYVLDTSASRVVKYDITGYLTDDNILKNQIIYIDSIGGLGGYNEENLFKDPRSIDIYNEYLYVLDSGNYVVKQFDKNFNYQTTYRLFRDFLSAYPVHLSHDGYGNMYVLTDQEYILKYDNNFQNGKIIPLDSLSASSEEYLRLAFSPIDPNIMYVQSNKNVYKKLVSQPDEDIGRYLFYLFNINTDENLTGFSILSSPTYDYNFIFSNYRNAGKISLWFDNINLFDVLNNNDFDIYTFDEIKLDGQEYLQNWVFNKAISKMLINHMRLRDQIMGKFIARRDSKGNITFRGTRYFTPQEYANIYFDQSLDNYIGMNEVFQNNIVNRCLKKIYDIQINMFEALAAELVTDYDFGKTLYIN